MSVLSDDWRDDFDGFMAYYAPDETYLATNPDVQSRLFQLGLGPINFTEEHTLRVLSILANTALEMALEISPAYVDQARVLLMYNGPDAYKKLFELFQTPCFNVEHINTFHARGHVVLLLRATRFMAMPNNELDTIGTAQAIAMWNFVRCEHQRLCGPARTTQLTKAMLNAMPQPNG